uniref:Ribosomal protein S8 n=1 Tax=Chloropicon laureae TaxID=464258 RepID=A0A4D6C4F2_9CHLO|nr:ribosomal protein S8 [Chloropicon laureae]QBX98582.1 ribosomal protein S8 [Chloropicon laureae]
MNTFSNFYSRVQNAQRLEDSFVEMPWSHKIWRVAILLKRLKYIEDLECLHKDAKKGYTIKLYLKKGAFSYLRQISKPSKRLYTKAKELKTHKKGIGSLIISTPLGLLSSEEASTLGVGGELMFEIY